MHDTTTLADDSEMIELNILFLSESYYPHGGGAELATFLYANLLSKLGYNIVVVTNRFDGETDISKSANLTVYRLPLFKSTESVKYSMLKRSGVLFSAIMRKLMKWADVVYVPRFWFSSILLAKAYGKPVIIQLHDYIPSCPLSNLFDVTTNTLCGHRFFCSAKCIYVYEKAAGRSSTSILQSIWLNSNFRLYFANATRLSDAVICVSRAQRDLILKSHKNLQSKIHVIYNPSQVSKTEITGDDFGFFGGTSYLKGFHVLCKAAFHTRSVEHKPLRINATKVLGLDNRLSGLLRELGIRAYGKLNAQEYTELYNRVRTVLVPSLWPEPLPYVVAEALSSGRILIASSVGGIPEQTTGCEGAFLFSAGDDKQLAEKILHVGNLTREELLDLGAKNRESFSKRFSNEKTMARFTKLLAETVFD